MTFYSKIADGLYASDVETVKSQKYDSNISAIINLFSDKLHEFVRDDIDVFDCALSSQELLDSEIPRTIIKLSAIADDIAALRANGRDILIVCTDGRNKSMLVGAYYLIARCALPQSIIATLTTIYFTAEQIKIDAQIAAKPTDEVLSAEESAALTALNALRCLTMASHRKILRLIK